MKRYKVTAPYITLKVLDLAGATVLGEFYQGALLPDTANEADRDRLIGKGMVEEVEVDDEVQEPADPAAPPEVAAGPPEDDKPPAGNASREIWAAYAATKGAPEEETRPVEEGGLSRDDLRAKYGA